jgi:hypothetical protein
MPSITSLGDNVVIEDALEKYGNVTMYIRCRDYHGNANVDEYAVRFCIHSGPDNTPVNHLFTKIIPESGSYLEFGKNEKEVVMYINEPAECKYSLVSEKGYESMENQMNCELDVNKRDLQGWKCETTLQGLNKDENNVYIKCLDQPWFKGTENESQRNVNSEDFVYTLYSSESELKIDSITPSEGEKIRKGFEPVDITLEVETSGGSENGKAVCFWGAKQQGMKVPMFNTNSNYHTQELNNWFRGEYEVYIECEDSGGNTVEEKTEFEIEIDNEAPEIARVFYEGGDLKITTDELAVCYYDLNRCNFNTEKANAMSIGLSKTHSVDWNPGVAYHIKCIDSWDNQEIGCTKIIKPSEF